MSEQGKTVTVAREVFEALLHDVEILTEELGEIKDELAELKREVR